MQNRRDEIKESIGYLKVVFSLLVVTKIGLIGWLVKNYVLAEKILIYADVILIIILLLSIIIINNKIISNIKKLKEL
jgi:hypothetical protein